MIMIAPCSKPELLGWDSSREATGYILYYGGESGRYTNLVTSASTEARVTGLMRGQKYFFAVTAVNNYGESDFSEEIVYTAGSFQNPPQVLTVTIQATTNLTTPWVQVLGPFRITNTADQQFFRATISTNSNL